MFAFAISWLIVGLVALGLGRSLLARRILTLSTLLLAAALVGWTLGPPRALVATETVLSPLHLAAAAHVMCRYPSGRLAGPAPAGSWRVYRRRGADGLWWTLDDDAVQRTVAECTDGPAPLPTVSTPSTSSLPLSPGRCLRDRVSSVSAGAWRAATEGPGQPSNVACCGPLSPPRGVGRSLRRPLLAGADWRRGPSTPTRWASSSSSRRAGRCPLSFLVGLISERLSYKRIGELVAGPRRPIASEDLGRSLAVALGDPQLGWSSRSPTVRRRPGPARRLPPRWPAWPSPRSVTEAPRSP